MQTIPHLDRGYAWFVLFAGAINFWLCQGFVYSLVIFKKPLKEYFSVTEEQLNYLVPTFCFIQMFSASFFIKLKMFLSIRKIIFICTMMTSASFIIASIQSSYFMVFLFLVVFPGFFTSGEYVACIDAMDNYFCKYKRLALTLSNAGLGIGVFFYPYFFQYFIENYTWRMAIFSFGLFHLNQLIPTAAFIRASLWRRKYAEKEVDISPENNFILVLVEKENALKTNQLKYIYNLSNEKWNKDDLIIDTEKSEITLQGHFKFIMFGQNLTLSEKIRYHLKPLTNIKVFYNEIVVTRDVFVFNFSCSLFLLSSFIVINILTLYYEDIRITQEELVKLNLIMGILSLSGRISSAFTLTLLPWLEANIMFFISCTGMLINCFFLYSIENYYGQLVCCIFYGLFSISASAYINAVCFELAGPEKMIKAISQNTMWQGIGLLLTPFASNLLLQYVENFRGRFMVCGSIFGICMFLMLPIVLKRIRLGMKKASEKIDLSNVKRSNDFY